ncbi:hypothetical protein ABDD95_17000 [Mucilaginibacter sp. PAMB04274]|uniref:hypothetical protein n=1 Tax=Mucilaginibacter sp. PAMB04274 TaxID=3138568 RepID=UPI0031F6FD25
MIADQIHTAVLVQHQGIKHVHAVMVVENQIKPYFMLELQLKSLKSTTNFVRIGFIPIWMLLTIAFIKFGNFESGQIIGAVVGMVIGGTLVYGYSYSSFHIPQKHWNVTSLHYKPNSLAMH